MEREPDFAWRVVVTSLGGLWLLDGILQLQPAMFTNLFVNTVLAPNLQNQPVIITNIVAFGIRIFSINIFWWNVASALIQFLIAALFLAPYFNTRSSEFHSTLRERAQRFGLWLSVVWALVVWVFGEGFGGLATGSATFYNGAPGSALLYLILALFLLYYYPSSSFEKIPHTNSDFPKKLAAVCGALFILTALLNLTPTVGNLLAVDVLACLGIFLIFMPNRPVACIVLAFLFAVWWIGQDFGGLLTFPFGIATDPNSAPLFALFLLPIFFSEKSAPAAGA